MSSDQRSEEQKQREKLLVNFDADLLSKLFEAKDHNERVSILGPVAIAMLWDSGQISDAGMSREVHEQYVKLTRKIEEQLKGVDTYRFEPRASRSNRTGKRRKRRGFAGSKDLGREQRRPHSCA